jgi:hypothetical protein
MATLRIRISNPPKLRNASKNRQPQGSQQNDTGQGSKFSL